MSERYYSTLNSNIPGHTVQPESSFSYWGQQHRQAIPQSQEDLLPLNPYVSPSNHHTHPPAPCRPVPFASPTAASEADFALYPRRPSDISSSTLSPGTSYQNGSGEVEGSEIPPRYLNYSNHALPGASSPLSYPESSYFKQSSLGGPYTNRSVSNANGSFTFDQAFAGPDLVPGSQSSPRPLASPGQQVTIEREQYVTAPTQSLSQISWPSSTDFDTLTTRISSAQNDFRFENTFATTCNDRTKDSYSGGTSLSGTRGNNRPKSIKRQSAVESSKASEKSTIPRRRGATTSKAGTKPPKNKNVLQGTSQEDGFNIHVFHQVEGQPPRTMRSNFGPERRREVARVREEGACFECRFSKQRCDEARPCERCKEKLRKARESDVVKYQLCFRLDLVECSFFRTKSALWTEPLRHDFNWISPSHISLNVAFGGRWNEPSPSLTFECRRFNPRPSDILGRKWGTKPDQIITVPPYCVPDISTVRSNIPNVVFAYSDFLLQKAEHLGPEAYGLSEMVLRTLRIASSRSHNDPVLTTCLAVFFGARFIAQPRTLRGNNAFSIKPVDEKDAHDQGYIPIPPMLDYQLDTSTIRWMEEMMGGMLTRLWKTLLSRSKADWFNVYLIILILVSNLEIIRDSQLEYIDAHGYEDSSYFGSHIRRCSEPMIERWEHTAYHLMHVWKVYKRRVLPNAPLFSKEYFAQAVAAGVLDDEAQEYYKYVISIRSGPNFQTTPTKWIYQLIMDETV